MRVRQHLLGIVHATPPGVVTMPCNCAVYALGLYVDVPAAKSALRQYSNKAPDALIRDQGFYDGAPS